MRPENLNPDEGPSEGLVGRQRAANEELVLAGVRAQGEADEARDAQARAEAIAIKLRESEERYRTLFDTSPVAVYACDASGVIQEFNRNAAQLWGREPAVGDTDEHFCGSFKMFRPDGTFMPHDLCPMAEVVSGKVAEVRDAEVLIERPDGSRVTVLANIRPVKNERGEVTGAINCFFDITERKAAERVLVDSLNRERELAEFRERFIAIVGHDLRNPLNTIVMATGCQLSRGKLTDEDARLAIRAINSGHRMARMIQQLVEFTRARLGGGFDLTLEPHNLGDICRDIAEELRISSSVEVVQTSEGDVNGFWDADRLAQVVSNIAGNAVAHAASGTPVLIRSYRDASAMVVEITNQGPCIPPEALPVIFKAFRRGEVNSPSGHLGLGLYIAYEIVRSHGGTLDVRSSDRSTTFTIRLPQVSLPHRELAS